MHVLHVLAYPGQVLVHPGVNPGEVWPEVCMITIYKYAHNININDASRKFHNNGEG